METIEALAARLRTNPADSEAYLALKTLYREQGDHGSLANLIAGWAGWVGDDRAASSAYLEVGDVLAQQLCDLTQAEAFYLEALRRDPLNFGACEALHVLWEGQGEYNKLSDFLHEQLQALGNHGASPKQLAVLRYRLGDLWGKRLERPAQALHHYRKALDLDPGLLRAMYEARQLLIAQGDLRGAAELYEREAATESSPERKVALLTEVALLYRDEIDDLDGAVSSLQQAHSLAPDDAALSYELAALLIRRAERSDDRTALGDHAQAADLMYAIATGLPRDEAISYFETALRYAPGHEPALAALEDLLEGSERALELATHWVAYLASTPSEPQAHQRRVKLARAYMQQGQIEDAVFCLEPAAEQGFAAARELLGQLGRSTPASAPVQSAPAESTHGPATRPPRRSAAEPTAGPDRARARASQPAISSSVHDTLDLNEEKTAVGEPGLIDSLRDAAALELRAPSETTTTLGARAAAGEPAARLRRDDAAPMEELEAFDALDLEPEPELQAEPQAEPELAGSPMPEPPPLSAAELQALRQTAGELARERHEEQAAAAYVQLLHAEPLDREAFAFLDGYYRRKQEHQLRAQLLEQSAAAEGLPARVRITRLREAASTYEARLKNYDAAIRSLRLLALVDPDSDEVERALKRLFERAERWPELAQLLEAEIARTQDAAPKLPLLRRLANVHRDRLGDRAAAADALERILMLKPEDGAVRDALIEDLLATERYDDVVPLIERKIDEAPAKSQKLALLAQLATLCRDELRDPDRAFAVYERVLALAPDDTETLAQLARMDEAAGNYERMLATLERHAALLESAESAEILARMASIADERLGDRARSCELLSRAVDLAPSPSAYLRRLCELYEQDERYDDLVELLRERTLLERNPQAQAELHRRIAHVLGERLSDGEGAREAWEKLLQIKEDSEALHALRQYALERDEPETLVKLLGRLIAIETDALARRDLLFDRARLFLERLRRTAEAIADLLRILVELDPDFEEAFEQLRSASKAADDYRGLAQVLEQRLSRSENAEQRIAHARQLADLYEAELTDPERAIAALDRWVQADPEDPTPRRRLCPLLARTQRYESWVATLDALAYLEDEAEARERATIRAAELAYTKLKDADGAWQRLLPWVETGSHAAIEAAIALSESTQRLDDLYEVLERSQQIEKLLSLLRQRTTREKDQVVRAQLLRKIAQLLIEYVQDEAGAAEVYRRVLELEEDADALRFLQSLAIRHDDPQTLVDVLRRLAAIEPSAEERRNLLYERARLLRARLERPADAVAELQAILAQAPEFEPAQDELVWACEAAHDYATLATTLEQMLARARDAPTRAQLAARLAEVCEHELRDPSRTVTALQAFAQADPDNPEPHRKLRPQLQAAGRQRELLATLDALCRTEPQAEARIEATLAAATLAQNQLGDLEGAWQRLLPLLPEAEPRVDRALYALATEARRQDELYRLLEQAGRYDTLVEWLSQRIALEPDNSVKASLYRRMAHTFEGPLGDEEGASDAWSRLLKLEENAEALGFMRGLALRRDDMPALGDCLRRLAALEQESNEKRDLLYEYGHLLRSRLGRASDAVTVLREVVEHLDPDFEPALDELIQACEAVDDEHTLSWALERALGHETEPENRAELARRLAGLCQRHPSERERAIVALKVWAEAAPNDPEPERALVSLLSGSDRSSELLAALDAVAAKDDDQGRRRDATLAAAGLAFERLGDAGGAFNRLAPLAGVGDEAAEVLLARIAFEGGKSEDLIALYQAQERYDDLVGLLRAQAERTAEPRERAELYRRCARLLRGPLADELAAAEAFREVLSFAEDPEALDFLRRQAVRVDDPVELADILRRLAASTTDLRQQRDLLFERALLLADRLEQPDQAASLLRSILVELDPSFPAAIEELIAICEARDDYAGLAVGLERQLVLARTDRARAEIAERLAGLYEDKLEDPAKATVALLAWSAAEPRGTEPLRRLRPQVERAGKWAELLATLDALAALEPSAEARNEAALAAAQLAWRKQSDAEGAWQRLSPLVLVGDDEAELAAQELASQSGQFRPLVNLYLMRAQQPKSPQTALRDWMQAAKLYEQQLHDPSEALEADLRALALDMQNRGLLDEIDRLAIAATAWDRLWRVYNRLVQEAPDTETKVELLARNAALLGQHGGDPATALERLLHACKLAPRRDDLLERAQALATQVDSHAELVWIDERLAHNASNHERRARYLMRAARVADLGLKDREHALRDIAHALAVSDGLPQIAAEIEDLARELDQARPELGKEDARRGLIRTHMELAQQLGEPFGPVLALRASQLLRDELGDDNACFDALKQGATLFPNDLDLYDALERAALKIKRLDALDAHLARSAQRATEPEVQRALLLRRAKLLADHLQRHAKAAEVYRELLEFDPNNGTAFEAMLRSLRQAGRYQELLKLYNDRLAHTEELAAKLNLMRQMALLWEIELKNRPSAVELWRVVSALAPDDQEAAAALSRLGAG
jgi:tetratricopeptide (TPR) repeat protein